MEHCNVFILSHQLSPLQSIFYFQGRQVLCSGGEDQEVEVVLKYVDQDKSLMSGTHCSSLLDFSLDSTLETSSECSLYTDEAVLPWPELGERQQGYYVRKAREVIETAFNCLAPGGEADLWFATMKSMPFSQ